MLEDSTISERASVPFGSSADRCCRVVIACATTRRNAITDAKTVFKRISLQPARSCLRIRKRQPLERVGEPYSSGDDDRTVLNHHRHRAIPQGTANLRSSRTQLSPSDISTPYRTAGGKRNTLHTGVTTHSLRTHARLWTRKAQASCNFHSQLCSDTLTSFDCHYTPAVWVL